MANWRKTRTPAIYVAHSKTCPAYDNAAARCRCNPSWHGRAWDPAARKPIWQKATKSRPEVHAWLAAMGKGTDHLAELANVGPTFEALGEQWLDGVERGHIGRRRGRGKAYSDTTIQTMRCSWRYRLLPEFGPRIAEEITEIDWQRWIDELARSGLKRSTIAFHVSVASGIYTWASAPSRRLVPRKPAASCRAAAKRRDTAPARRARARDRGAARRAEARGSSALRHRLLRRSAPLRDRPPGVGRRPGRRRDRDSPHRPPLQERSRHAAASADR